VSLVVHVVCLRHAALYDGVMHHHLVVQSLLCELLHTGILGVGADSLAKRQDVAAVELKGGIPGCHTDIAVQCKLDHGAQCCPVLLVVANHGPQHLSGGPIGPFSHSICLGME